MKNSFSACLAILALALILGWAAAPQPAGAQSLTSFRCGNLFMDEGTEKMLVLARCGQPVATEKTWIDRYGEVEKLVYGPDGGVFHVLYFFGGRLIAVDDIRQ